VILGWISETAGEPWFPSRYAAASGINRDSLDEPLSQLRVAGLILVVTWVRGVGQGYALTEAGEKALATGAGLQAAAKATEPVSSGSLPAVSDPGAPLTGYETDTALSGEARASIVVPALLIANVLWFCIGLAGAIWGGYLVWNYLLRGNVYLAHRLGSAGGEELLRGEWWRLFTCCFVHAGAVHLIVNLFALAMIGPLAEHLWGRRHFLVIYLLSGLGGSALAVAMHPQFSVVGASGAIWGVLMSLVVWFMVFRVQIPSDVTVDVSRRLGLMIVLNLCVSLIPGISWQAHLGGAVVGFVTAFLLNAVQFGRPVVRRVALAAVAALPALIVLGLVWVMGHGENWLTFRERLAEARARQSLEAANKVFNQDIAPLLRDLSPEKVSPVERAAVGQLARTKAKRNARTVDETKAHLTELKSLADRARVLLDVPLPDMREPNRRWELARQFAESRSNSFATLLDLLEQDPAADWSRSPWGESRSTANRLWEQGWQQ
jgi:rhomboid protease GluP